MSEIRHNWTKEEILEIYNRPLLSLIYDAATVHRIHHDPNEVQISSLLSVKTGGCTEDCSYCPQAARYQTEVEAHGLLKLEDVLASAQNAKEGGASRMCLGAAWREVRDNRDFDNVLEMVKGINKMEMEVCCTLGMLSEEQAQRLADAGLYAYNHNIDTSEENYNDVITTRTFDDRIGTHGHVRKAGVTLCSGGIIGLGESVEDRAGMVMALANASKHPESVPINALVPVAGTPMENNKKVSIWEMVRMVATARIVMPASVIRLSAGRKDMNEEGQAFCFMAGASSIFAGDKLLTTPNPEFNEDVQLFKTLGLRPKTPFQDGAKPETNDRYKESTKKKEQEAKMKAWREEHKDKSVEDRLMNIPEVEG
jgi:biotin synthase